MALFRKRSDYTSDHVETALRANTAALERAEQTITDYALAGVEQGDPRARQAAEALTALFEERRVLHAAREAATRQEQAIELERLHRQRQATHKALAAHLGRVRKFGAEMQDAIAAMRRAWDGMSRAAEAARALLPPQSVYATDFRSLHEPALAAAITHEMARQFSRHTRLGPEPAMPTAPRLPPGQIGDTAPAMVDVLARDTDFVARSHRALLGLDNHTEPAPRSPRGGEGEGGTGGQSMLPSPNPQRAATATVEAPQPAPASGDSIDAEAASDALQAAHNPHTEGTPEHDGFEAALREIADQPARQRRFSITPEEARAAPSIFKGLGEAAGR